MSRRVQAALSLTVGAAALSEILKNRFRVDPIVSTLTISSSTNQGKGITITLMDQDRRYINEFVDYPSADIFVAVCREMLPCRLTQIRAAAQGYDGCIQEYSSY